MSSPDRFPTRNPPGLTQPLHHSAARRAPASYSVWADVNPPNALASTSSLPSSASSLWLYGPLPPIHTGVVYPSSSSECSPLDMTFPSSPSDSSSSLCSGPSPVPEFTHIICNAPLVAPKPLPYHSPTFLLYDLPDDDEDLSHPPYVGRPHKRKRNDEDSPKATTKRRALPAPSAPHWPSPSDPTSLSPRLPAPQRRHGRKQR